MFALYLLIYIFLAFYFFTIRKKIDSFLFLFIGFSVYFFPLLFGKLPILSDRGFLTSEFRSIHPDFIISIVLFLFIFLVSVMLYDMKYHKKKPILNNSIYLKYDIKVFKVVKFITLSLFLIILILTEINLSLSKTEIQNKGGYYLTAYIYSFSLYLIFSLYNKFNLNIKFDYIFIIMVLFTLLFFKQRSLVILPIIAFLFYFKWNSYLKLRYIKYLFYIFVLLLLILLSKVFGNILFLGIDYSVIELLKNLQSAFEPFTINAVINEIYYSNFVLDSTYLTKTPLFVLPGLSSIAGIESGYFFQAYQPSVFPNVNFGLAYSPIAESFVTLGFMGIIIFSISMVGLCVIINLLFNSSNGYLQVFISLISVYLFFYIFRNSLFTAISYEKNYLYFFIFIIVISMFFKNKIILSRKV